MNNKRSSNATLVELTPKHLKLNLALSGICTLSGALIAFLGSTDLTRVLGGLIIGFALLWYLVTKIRIWWNHG